MIVHGKFGSALTASMGSPEAKAFLGQFQLDVIYTDPPWGQSTMKAFQKGLGGFSSAREMEDELAALIAERVSRCAFIEYGVKYTPSLLAALERRGLACESITVRGALLDAWVDRPDKWQDYSLIIVSKGLRVSSSGLGRFKNYDLVRECMRRAGPPGTVADVFAGFGRMLQVGIDLGWRVVGVEINPRRIQGLLKRLN